MLLFIFLAFHCAKFFLRLQIWKAVKQGLQSSSNRNLTKILWRVQNDNSQRLIDFVLKMEECEFKKVGILFFFTFLFSSPLLLPPSHLALT